MNPEALEDMAMWVADAKRMAAHLEWRMEVGVLEDSDGLDEWGLPL